MVQLNRLVGIAMQYSLIHTDVRGKTLGLSSYFNVDIVVVVAG